MSESSTRGNDEALSRLLKTWKPEAELPPRFQEAVWRRIESAERARAGGLVHVIATWIEKAFSRPALGVSYVAVLLVVGVGAGLWQAEGKAAQAQSVWRARYVQSIDPYQMPR